MKQLSAEDAFFFYIETPQQHQHTLGVLLLDPSEAGKQFSVAKMVEKMEKDIDVIPEFRQKLHNLPFYVAPPALVDDPKFKFKNHVKVHTLPKPGTRKQLCELLEKISSKPLDKKRPLWEAWFIDGLEDGMIATNDLPDQPLICVVPVSMKLKGEQAQ